MKEAYVTPRIHFESFTLSQNIAKNCGDNHKSTMGESTHYNEQTCTWDLPGGDLKIFWADPCTYLVDEDVDLDEDIEGLCYNNPDGGQHLFSST